jgi:peroxiredoxin Q/BCP
MSRRLCTSALLFTVCFGCGRQATPSGPSAANQANTTSATTEKTPEPTGAQATAATPSPAAEPNPSAGTPSDHAATAEKTATTTAPAGAEVTVGQPPPDFTAKAQDGTTVHLAALKGKSVVVYFYPKDETPGCTKEACSFRDAWNDLKKTGVVLIGISADSDESHKAFATHHKLPFLLVSDPQGKIAATFGVPFNNGYTARQSFVVGADGNVKRVYRTVDVTAHAREILGDIKG